MKGVGGVCPGIPDQNKFLTALSWHGINYTYLKSIIQYIWYMYIFMKLSHSQESKHIRLSQKSLLDRWWSLLPLLSALALPSPDNHWSSCPYRLVCISQNFILMETYRRYLFLSSVFHQHHYWDSFMLFCVCQEFILLYGWVVFHRMDIPQFVSPFTCWWTGD